MSDQLTASVIQVIAKTQHLPPESITIDKTFAELKIDSLDGMNILFAVESEFDISIPDDQAAEIKSVREMVEGIRKAGRRERSRSSRMTRRVAVTGIGVIAAPGSTRAAFWESLRAGRSAIRPMTLVPEGSLRFPNAAEVRDYRASDYMDEKEADLLDRFAQFALIAAREAVAESGFVHHAGVRSAHGSGHGHIHRRADQRGP